MTAHRPVGTRHAWVDASAGIAGDMLLGALIDAGADLAAVRAAVEAVAPDSVRLTADAVTRAGQRAVKITVEVLADDPPHRSWATIKETIERAGLDPITRSRALAVFGRLAQAESRAHGIPEEEVHFHEVGALDSIADVVGVCAALTELGVRTVSGGGVAVGSGRARTAHGDLPVPAPAVVRLAAGWRIHAGGSGELATPTGMALLVALADACEELPPMTLATTGAGAGSVDVAGRPNITRVLIGDRWGAAPAEPAAEPMVLIEANVDDLDPRLLPGVLDGLLVAGAADTWLVPITMKKGRPAHVVTALCRPDQVSALSQALLRHSSTLGVRATPTDRMALARGWFQVEVLGRGVRVKIGYDASGVRQANPEFADIAALAAATGRTEREVLDAARAAARAAGLVIGSPVPEGLEGPRPGSG